MKGIRGRLTINFMIVILVSVAFMEVLLISTVQQNYYGSLRTNLANQAKINADLYSQYDSDQSSEDRTLYNKEDALWEQTATKMQITNKEGRIVMDSTGVIPDQGEPDLDIRGALDNKLGEWVGKMNGQKVMAVAYPLKSDGQIVGVIRLIASTETIDQDIRSTMRIFIFIGLFVILTSWLLSILLANTILVPLQEITAVAETMATGNFRIRYEEKRKDEIGRLSDTLNFMADEILKKEQLKNDFISSVSHELRTPLTSIMGWAITLQSEKFQQKEMLNDGLGIIATESERLTRMVEELLDFSKFISGRIKLECKTINLKELLESIRIQMTPRTVRENIDLIVSYPEDLPDLMSDSNRLKQLFINVLDNALNFTEAGGFVRFQVETTEKEYQFTITDSGCGIVAEELPMVKEKFYKGKGSHSQNGIGLSICEEIIILMGGRIEIASEVNVGTEVHIFIPQGDRSNDETRRN